MPHLRYSQGQTDLGSSIPRQLKLTGHEKTTYTKQKSGCFFSLSTQTKILHFLSTTGEREGGKGCWNI